MQSEEDLLHEIQKVLADLFDLSAEQVTREADLNADLGLDSIDAVDMVVKLQEITGKKLSPSEFKSIRTVGDIVTAVCKLLQEGHE
ncbi:MAG: acyl carrier protein [Verrucomicrobia bacterium]|nr:acyl carrier protein [Verrucomicrobiota bacterium]